MDRRDRAEGVLLGLACGDALGRPVEFNSTERIAAEYGQLTEMVGNGTWNQPAGTITDDTEQALCIARSLVERGAFDPEDIAERFVAWYNSGPFDTGVMTADALREVNRGTPWDVAGRQVWEAKAEGSNAGNGSVMRCAPLAVAFADDTNELQQVSRDSSRITHADPRCTHGCAALNLTIAALLNGDDQPLASALDVLSTDAPDDLNETLESNSTDTAPAGLLSSGFVLHTLQTALYHALTADSAEEAIVNAVNEGGDTDTIGAVAGAVAGARFGATGLPERWIESIDEGPLLRKLAHRLYSFQKENAASEERSGDSFTVAGTEIRKETTKRASEYTRPNIGHRPDPVPTQVLGKPSWKFTPEDAAFFDWERRAYLSAEVNGTDPDFRQSSVRVPDYAFVDSFDSFPTQDQERIHDLHNRATEALSNAEAALQRIRDPIRHEENEATDIPSVGQITSVTRQAVVTVGQAKEQLENPEMVLEAARTLTELRDDAYLLIDMLSWGIVESLEITALRDQAVTMLGEVQLALSTLRALTIRHLKVDAEKWNRASAEGDLNNLIALL
jgi:ADP-ribosyl-[dinitrogen reductase] hydrolase